MSSLQSFKESFKGVVAAQGDAEYNVKRWADNASRQAKYVAYPTDANDISQAILFAKSENLELAVRGGGHSSSGASSTEGGLVVDLSKNLNGVRVDPDKKLAYAQGGAIWQTFEEETIKHGLAGCAGLVNQTGVGGFTLGGGFGCKIGTHGLALDSLVEATIVIASGEVIKANEAENPDIFWGIRGAGSNFGVVSEFVFQLHEQRPEVYTAMMFFMPPKLADICAEVKEWVKTQTPDESLFVLFTSCPTGSPMIGLGGHKNSDESAGTAAFKCFVDLGPVVNMSKQIPYAKLNGRVNPPPGGNKLTRGCRIPSWDYELMQKVFDARVKMISEQPAGTTNTVVWEFYHLDKMASIPAEATAFADRSKDMNVNLSFKWTDDAFTSIATQETAKLAQVVSSGATKIDQKFIGYSNYADAVASLSTDEYSKLLYGINYPRLQEIKKKYDPDMVFKKWFPITPAA